MADIDYQKIVELNPNLRGVFSEQIYEHMKKVDKKTKSIFDDVWRENITYNVTKLLPKCGWINESCCDIGRKKAVIAIGAGPSLKKNEDVLKMLSMTDGTLPVEQQDFILMASNHQVKPCFEKGIYPHFAMVADPAESLKDQLDVGDAGKHTILLAAVTAHPSVVEAWPGPVVFFCPASDDIRKYVEAALEHEYPVNRCVTEGGNILNISFVISVGLFHSSVWMCVGNDLSFPIDENIDNKRTGFYADGDYTTNIKSRRDEAHYELTWAAFKYPETNIVLPKDYINLELVHTSPQLFVYKSWLETNAMLFWNEGSRFKIYNCSEGGILGVNLREEALKLKEYDKKFSKDNWFLLDEVSNGNWRTRKLIDAVEEFHHAKEILEGRKTWQESNYRHDAPSATNMVVPN